MAEPAAPVGGRRRRVDGGGPLPVARAGDADRSRCRSRALAGRGLVTPVRVEGLPRRPILPA
jgi:hypothetical protein